MSAHCRAGAAILVATHSRALAAEADRIVHLQDGRIVDD
jgi:putative ABC transport system ATP-binding protein